MRQPDYVVRGTYRVGVFLRMLANRLTGDPHFTIDDEDFSYLGSGYWRCRSVKDEIGNILGFKLINPDYTAEEIAVVTEAMNILLR